MNFYWRTATLLSTLKTSSSAHRLPNHLPSIANTALQNSANSSHNTLLWLCVAIQASSYFLSVSLVTGRLCLETPVWVTISSLSNDSTILSLLPNMSLHGNLTPSIMLASFSLTTKIQIPFLLNLFTYSIPMLVINQAWRIVQLWRKRIKVARRVNAQFF
jgi:hypothetical protein